MLPNFFYTVFQTLLGNREKELIRWPLEGGGSKTYTGGELIEKIAAIRMVLLNRQAAPAQPILLALPVSIDLICAVFAVQAIGAVPVLPPAKASAGSMLQVIKKQQIRLVLTARSPSLLLKTVAWTKKIRFAALHNLPRANQAIDIVTVSPHQPALVSHSSGSTGKAKAIYRSHQVLLAQHTVLKETFPPWPGQIDFPLFPNILLHNLAIGITSVLPRIPRFALAGMEPAAIAGQLVKDKVQTLTGNVFYFKRLAAYFQKHALSFPQVRAIGIGGSPVPETLALLLKNFFTKAGIYIIYGSSEAEPIAVRKVQDETIHPLAGYKVGKVNRDLQLTLSAIAEVAVAGRRYPVGEIIIKGPHVAISNGMEALHTGDFGYVDEQDELYLTARKGNEQICNGLQHYQVEHLLAQDQRVEQAAAIVQADGFNIYVQGDIQEQEIFDILKKWIDSRWIKRIHKRNKIPVDARHFSKILYPAVR